MTLSVTGAAGALAALQSLSTPPQTAASSTSTSQGAAKATPTASLLVSTSGGGANAQALFAAVDGVGQALTAADAADAAGQTVIGLLQQLRDTAGEASAPSTGADRRAELHQAFQSAAAAVAPALSEATVNGVNLVDGSQASGLKASLGEGSTLSLTPQDLTLGGPDPGAVGGRLGRHRHRGGFQFRQPRRRHRRGGPGALRPQGPGRPAPHPRRRVAGAGRRTRRAPGRRRGQRAAAGAADQPAALHHPGRGRQHLPQSILSLFRS